MKAVKTHGLGGPVQLFFEDAPVPVVRPGDVLVRVRARGITPAELTYLRRDLQHELRGGERAYQFGQFAGWDALQLQPQLGTSRRFDSTRQLVAVQEPDASSWKNRMRAVPRMSVWHSFSASVTIFEAVAAAVDGVARPTSASSAYPHPAPALWHRSPRAGSNPRPRPTTPPTAATAPQLFGSQLRIGRTRNG